MKRKNKFIVSEKLQKEFEQRRKTLAVEERRREKLLRKIAEKPSGKLREELVLLDDSIAEHTRQLPSENLLKILEYFDDLAAQVFDTVDKYDDKLLLTMGADAPQKHLLASLQVTRNELHDSGKEHAFEMVTGLDGVIGKLAARIEEKRQRAAKRFPELARIKPREYPMPDFYNESLKQIVMFTEMRDKAVKEFKFTKPERRREAAGYIEEMDKLLDQAEACLAQTYEDHQRKQFYLDKIRDHLKTASQTELNELRAELKKNPTSNGALEYLLRVEFPKQV